MRAKSFVMKRVWALLGVMLTCCVSTVAQTRQISFHCASLDEGRQLIDSRADYYAGLSRNDLEWRMRKTNATLDEFKAYAKEQVQEFTQDEKNVLQQAVDSAEKHLARIGCRLPFPADIALVKTTMSEEGGAGGYTNGSVIYLGSDVLKYVVNCNKKDADERTKWMGNMSLESLLLHEMFHCLTRANSDFRSSMYNLIGFNILDHDIDFPAEVKQQILTNPDVEHMDNYIEVTIDGEKRKCELVVRFVKTWADAAAVDGNNATFFNNIETVLVPLDDLTKAYPVNDMAEFWEKVGRNTAYVVAPEECLADNFSLAVIAYGEKNAKFHSPELTESLVSLLKVKYGK